MKSIRLGKEFKYYTELHKWQERVAQVAEVLIMQLPSVLDYPLSPDLSQLLADLDQIIANKPIPPDWEEPK